MRRFLTILLVCCALPGIAMTALAWSHLLVPVDAHTAPALAIRAGVPTLLHDRALGYTMLCVSNRSGEVLYPLLHP